MSSLFIINIKEPMWIIGLEQF